MTHLIDKDALVAEIERLMTPECGYSMNKLLDYIDTLEVKEVDLKDEVERFAKECGYKSAATIDFQFAEHFFELGMRVNNPITAADRGMVEEIIINLKRVEQDYNINLTREMEWLRNKVKKGE